MKPATILIPLAYLATSTLARPIDVDASAVQASDPEATTAPPTSVAVVDNPNNLVPGPNGEFALPWPALGAVFVAGSWALASIGVLTPWSAHGHWGKNKDEE